MLKRSIIGALLLSLSVMMGVAPAQTEPKPEPDPGTSEGTTDVVIKASAPESTPLVGDTFDLIFYVSNNGPETAPEVSFSTYLSDGFRYVTSTSSDPTDSCSIETYEYPASPVEDGGSSSPSAGSDAYLSCALGEVAITEVTTLIVTVERTGARDIYTYGNVWTSAQETNYDNGYSEIYIAPDKTKMADVGISMTGPNGEVSGDFAYEIQVANDGPTDADDVTVVDYIPAGVDAVSIESSDVSDLCALSDTQGGADPVEPGGSPEPDFYRQEVATCELGTLGVGESTTLTLQVSRVSGWEIWNSAYATSSSYDPNYENDYASFQIAADPSVTSDLSVAITTDKSVPRVGEEKRLTFGVENAGPSTAGDLFLTNFIPEGLEFVSFETARAGDSCSFNDYSYKDQAPYTAEPGAPESSGPSDASFPVYYGGSSFSCSLNSLASGDSTSVTLVFKRVGAREIYEYVSVYSSNYDPRYEDNYAELHIDADRSNPADIAVSMDAPKDPKLGSAFDYNVTVTNNGPAAASGVAMSDPLPWGVDFVGVTSSDETDVCEFSDYNGYDEPREMESSPSFYGYREVRCDLGSMDAGESTQVTLSVSRTSEYEIWNSAYVTSRSFDENYDNDYAYVGSTGEAAYPCGSDAKGTGGPDEIVVDDCFVESGAGADRVEVFAGSSSVDRSVSTGRGADSVTINVPSGSEFERMIEVDSGGGADTINVVVGPGATNATIVVRGGSQADVLNLDIAPSAAVIRVVFKGAGGSDTVRALRYGQSIRDSSVRLIGGPGRDLLMGTNSSDLLFGGRGEDVLDGGFGDDTLDGGKAFDVCRDGPGADHITRC